MFLCRPFRIDQQFFIVVGSFFLLSWFAFAKVHVSIEYEGMHYTTAWFQYKGVMEFNDLQLGKMLSPKLTFNTTAYTDWEENDENFSRGGPLPSKERMQAIGAVYEDSIRVENNTARDRGAEWVGKHITTQDNTSMVPMVAGTKGNNYFGCFWASIRASNRIDIISDDKVAYSLRGSEFQNYYYSNYRHTNSGPAAITSVHLFVNFYCEDCEIQKVIFYTGPGRPFITDRHTIGWYTRKTGRFVED